MEDIGKLFQRIYNMLCVCMYLCVYVCSDRRSTRDSYTSYGVYKKQYIPAAAYVRFTCAEDSGGQVWTHGARVAEAQRKFHPEKPSFSEETS